MIAEPVTTGTCSGCGKPRTPANRNHNKANSGTRIPAYLWAASIEADPFCSAECCRAFYGLRTNTVAEAALGSCPDCGKQHSRSRNRRAGDRCGTCANKYRRQRKYHIPGRCAGCGGDLGEVTFACPTCGDRARRRERRANDPGFVERENARHRERRQARDAEKKKLSSACRLAAVEPPLTSTAPARGGTLQPTEIRVADVPAEEEVAA